MLYNRQELMHPHALSICLRNINFLLFIEFYLNEIIQ